MCGKIPRLHDLHQNAKDINQGTTHEVCQSAQYQYALPGNSSNDWQSMASQAARLTPARPWRSLSTTLRKEPLLVDEMHNQLIPKSYKYFPGRYYSDGTVWRQTGILRHMQQGTKTQKQAKAGMEHQRFTLRRMLR